MTEKLIENFEQLKVNILKELDLFHAKLDYFKLSDYQKQCIEYINDDTPTSSLNINAVIQPKKTGYIYALKSPNIDLIYIGSTFQSIHRRFKQHLSSCKNSSAIIITAGNAFVELIEEYPCDSRLELCRREGHHIQENILKVVNYSIAGRTLKESQKAYKEKHKEWYRNYMIQWRKDNKEKIKQYYLKKK
jgi:hypothetical protein